MLMTFVAVEAALEILQFLVRFVGRIVVQPILDPVVLALPSSLGTHDMLDECRAANLVVLQACI